MSVWWSGRGFEGEEMQCYLRLDINLRALWDVSTCGTDSKGTTRWVGRYV